jgi:hypothetical protein
MLPVQVILANEPRLLRGLLSRAFNQSAGLEVVEEITDLADLPAAVARTGARWVIVSLWSPGQVPSAVQAVLDENPAVCALGLAAGSSDVRIRCGESREDVLHNPSLDELLATLRHPMALAGNGTQSHETQARPGTVREKGLQA